MMKITLQQDQIKAAILQYLASQGLNLPEGGAEVEFSTVRKGGLRITADVDLAAKPTAQAGTLALASTQEAVVSAAPAAQPQEEAPAQAPAEAPAAPEAPVEPQPQSEAPAAPTESNSLFG